METHHILSQIQNSDKIRNFRAKTFIFSIRYRWNGSRQKIEREYEHLQMKIFRFRWKAIGGGGGDLKALLFIADQKFAEMTHNNDHQYCFSLPIKSNPSKYFPELKYVVYSIFCNYSLTFRKSKKYDSSKTCLYFYAKS